jgi:predicted transposase YdaD
MAGLWTATQVLMGLRYEEALVDQLLQGVIAMEESVTYQAIIAKGKAEGRDEGRLQEAKRLLLLQGRELLGEPGAKVTAAVEAIGELERVEQLSLRVLKATSWQELLGLPPHRSRNRKQGASKP